MPHIMQRPTIRETVRALKLIGRIVGASEATYCFEGRFAVPLAPGSGWWLVISPDDAGRFRVGVARSGRVRASMWCLVGDDDRLAELASSAAREAAALVA
jgi:hypothetical protein